MADKVHQGYARLRGEILEDEEDERPVLKRLDRLNEVLDSAHELSEEMTMPVHGRDDARLIYEASESYRKSAYNSEISADADLTSRTFVRLLQEGLRGNEENHPPDENGQVVPRIQSLDELYTVYNRRAKWAPSIGFLLGPFEIEKKVITRRGGPRTKDILDSEVQPDKITGLDGDQQKQASFVISIYKRLVATENQVGGPVPFYQFLLNPWSFSESVENVFYMSFLTRDGKVALVFDDAGTPLLSTKVKQYAASSSTGKDKKRKAFADSPGQVIIDLNMQQWKKLCQLMELTEPAIPSRGNDDTVAPESSS